MQEVLGKFYGAICKLCPSDFWVGKLLGHRKGQVAYSYQTCQWGLYQEAGNRSDILACWFVYSCVCFVVRMTEKIVLIRQRMTLPQCLFLWALLFQATLLTLYISDQRWSCFLNLFKQKYWRKHNRSPAAGILICFVIHSGSLWIWM